MMKPLLHKVLTAAATVSLLSLGACSASDEDTADLTTQENMSETVAELLGGESDLSTLATEIGAAGLSAMLDGQASYTLLAPTNAAFASIEGGEAMMSDPENGALIAAILREHILPGALTPEAIRQAATDNGGAVTMRTFGSGVVSFAVDGEAITMSIDGGKPAAMAGGAMVGSNGVVIPIDNVLVAPPAPAE